MAKVVLLIVIFLLPNLSFWTIAQQPTATQSQPQPEKLFPRLSGEFEPQKAILLSVCDWQPHHRHILIEIAQKTRSHVQIVILYNDETQKQQTVEWLKSTGEEFPHVSFCALALDTIWLRDFGPRIAEMESQTMSIDFFYNGVRPKDDAFPAKWAQLTDASLNSVRWTMQGGNLLSNGKGLALTTTRIFQDNYIRFNTSLPGRDPEVERRKIVVDAFKESCNIRELVSLKPLQNEATQHVDMFCTLLEPDLAVVAKVDRLLDPVNAQILDWNADKLKSLTVDNRPMRVVRIPFPPAKGKYWSAYTNVILANDLLLVPEYDGDDPEILQQALSLYRSLLPNHTVETINMTSMQKLEGALHCLSINVPQFGRLPATIPYMDANRKLPGSPSSPEEYVGSNSPVFPEDESHAESPLAAARPVALPKFESANQVAKVREPRAPLKNADSLRHRQAMAAYSYLRKFETASQSFSATAYAIRVSGDVATLVIQEDRRIVEIDLTLLRDADQIWLRKHQDKINRNGGKVQAFVLSTEYGVPSTEY